MSLELAAVLFAILFTAGMIAFDWPVDLTHAGMLAIGGIIAGVLWYLLTGWLMRRRAAGRGDPT